MASSQHKKIARSAADAFGGRPQVQMYWDDARSSSMAIISSVDAPVDGMTSYATIGVCEQPLVQDGVDIGVRTELVGACDSSFGGFANYLATAAFYVINSGYFVAPGVILPDVLALYEGTGEMRHMLLVPPFMWDEQLATLEFEDKTVAWLLCVPISDDEMHFAIDRGVPELESLFEEHQVDVADLLRASVV